MSDSWEYRIDAYKWMPDDGSFYRVSEAEATVWFGVRQKGEDQRVFGLFPTRADAEKATEIMKRQEAQEIMEEHTISHGMKM